MKNICRSSAVFVFSFISWWFFPKVYATPSKNPSVLARRGSMKIGTGTTLPKLTLTSPLGGWSSSPTLDIKGSCSDPSADPIRVSINGSRYYMRSNEGSFARRFPASPGKNNLLVECVNAAGTASFERIVTVATTPTRLQLVLTSDTDGVYTDLHIYEPDGSHVYWLETKSPTGGLFYLNGEGDSFDQPGFGPYIYTHALPPVGTFRVDVNYWPGGAMQHSLSNLEIIIDQGLPTEQRRRVQRPLAMPSETQTLAYITILPNHAPPKIFVPGISPESERPKDLPKIKKDKTNEEASVDPLKFLPDDERAARQAVVSLALQQAKKPSAAWDPAQRDCAGLLRFAFREAMRTRSAKQRQRLELPDTLPFPAVSGWGKRLVAAPSRFWKIGYTPDGKELRGEFAAAETLIANNFNRKSWRLEDAEPGDVIAFNRPLGVDSIYHLMMVVRSGDRRGTVVYHNGAKGRDGQVRVVAMSELFQAEDPLWRPERSNSSFLGVFSWDKFKSYSNVKKGNS